MTSGRTHCDNGHPQTPENVSISGGCKVCRRGCVKRYRDGKRKWKRYDWIVEQLHTRVRGKDCWPWPEGWSINDDGYGIVSVEGEDYFAHRAVFMLVGGPIDSGLVVRHSCDNPRCINPAHLLLGTQADNVQDSIDRGRHRSVQGKTLTTTISRLEKERDDANQRHARVVEECDRLRNAILWALGCNGHFPVRRGDQGAYW